MNVQRFFEHWSIAENPFRAEEARHDAVFHRLPQGAATHPDFDKVLGEVSAPSASVVFGEKGSGKTALRMQVAERVRKHNELARGVEPRVLLVGYDDLNPTLDRFLAAMGSPAEPMDALEQFSLVDHMDGILHAAVSRVVDAAVRDRGAGEDSVDLGEHPGRALRRMSLGSRRDLLLLQALYDRPEEAPVRTARLKRVLRLMRDRATIAWAAASWVGWVAPAAVLAVFFWKRPELTQWESGAVLVAFYVALALWGLVLLKRLVWDGFLMSRTARRVARQLRVMHRSPGSFAASLRLLHREDRRRDALPTTDVDDVRYAMLERLRRVASELGYSGVIVLVDRIDEPTVIAGDADRMKAFIWPLLNNKFLQAPGIGVKMLLPVELRHALFRESSRFFQEARLDKQNLVERLTWTGPMLYDLCNARLTACRRGVSDGLTLVDLFAEDVTRQDLVDALDQMHQPRDAFKLLYQCIQEHCSNVTDEQEAWRIPKLTLDMARKQQADRVQQLFRGVRPA